MASKTRRIEVARQKLVSLLDSYIECARGIDDITEEDDFTDYTDAVDEILEELLKGK